MKEKIGATGFTEEIKEGKRHRNKDCEGSIKTKRRHIKRKTK